MVAVRPLRWWPQPVLQQFAVELDDVLARWSVEWGISIDGSGSVAMNAGEVDAGESSEALWRTLFTSDDERLPIWIGSPLPIENVVASAIFHEPLRMDSDELSHSPAARQVTAASTHDLMHRLQAIVLKGAAPISVDASSESKPPVHDYQAWSGAVCVSFYLGPSRCAMHIGRECMEQRLGKNHPQGKKGPVLAEGAIEPLRNALVSHTVTLRTELDSVEIDLGSLESLMIGDVIRLSHPLSKPLTVVTESGVRWAQGYLGQVRGQRALELVRLNEKASEEHHES